MEDISIYLQSVVGIKFYEGDKEPLINAINAPLASSKEKGRSARTLNQHLIDSGIPFRIVIKNDSRRLDDQGMRNRHRNKRYWAVERI